VAAYVHPIGHPEARGPGHAVAVRLGIPLHAPVPCRSPQLDGTHRWLNGRA